MSEATQGSEREEIRDEGAHEDGFQAGPYIMHHILDSRELPIPFSTAVVRLPKVEIAGVDFSVTRNVATMWFAGVLLVVLFAAAARRVREPVPRGLRGMLEMLILFVRDEIARKNISHGADRYVSYLLSTFFFILTSNLLGLVPGFSTATSGISVTAGLAILAFLMVQWSGVREFGLAGHFKNLLPHGLPGWLVPIMLPVEILGMFTKPFALCVRLFANMTAGHVVILSLISLIFIMQTALMALVSVPFALFIYLLEILVAFLQAYIFTMLTSLFIGMAVHPAH